MSRYTAPFHMPKMSDADFLKQKADYIRKNGYTITFPNLGDVIHLGMTKPMTTEEKSLWYSKRRTEIPSRRLKELYAMKEQGRQRYRKVLGSPIPNIVTSYTSILTALDDAQDAIISLAAIGRIACKILPKFLSRFLFGPIGWVWLLAELMSLLMAPTACVLNPMGCKRAMKKKLMRRARNLKAGVRGYAKSGGFLPSFAEGIQLAQVSDNVFGIGLSIGPIFGLAYDLISGGVRWARGEKVSFARTPTDLEIYRKANDPDHTYARWKRPKEKMTRLQFQIWKERKILDGTWGVKSRQDDMIHKARRLHETWGGILRKTDWMEETLFYCGAEMAGQGVKNILDHWNPLENVEGLEHIEIEAYNEFNPIIEEMLIEEGADPEAGISWPQVGKRWATYDEIQKGTQGIAAANFNHFVDDCDNESLKIIGEQSAYEGGLHNLAMLEGADDVEIEYHAAIDITEMLLDHGFLFPPTITIDKIAAFADWTLAHQSRGSRPNLWETLSYAKHKLGIDFSSTRRGRAERLIIY